MTDTTKPTDKLNFTKAEMDCLNAAENAISTVSEKLHSANFILGHDSKPREYGTYANNLLTSIIHDKYDACVAASQPNVPNAKAPSANTPKK